MGAKDAPCPLEQVDLLKDLLQADREAGVAALERFYCLLRLPHRGVLSGPCSSGP